MFRIVSDGNIHFILDSIVKLLRIVFSTGFCIDMCKNNITYFREAQIRIKISFQTNYQGGSTYPVCFM